MSPMSSYAVVAARCTAVLLVALVLPRAEESVSQPGPNLRVPPGFDVEQAAGPPLVDRPIVADFDEEGRLYVADSSGSNDRVDRQLAERPHRIVRLEDTDGDGRFDTSVVFADRMMLPEGTMWLDGSLYVAAPPSIWKLTDTDGDGVADQREEWFQGQTLTGCANDLHGPYLGPDGWIYWTKGAFAQQTYERAGTQALVTRAAHIFRRRPDDPTIEVVMTGGMDNPVDVAFTPAGDRMLTATFVEHPQAGQRDGLLHAVYGGLYGKPHAVLDGHTRTGDLMPVMCQLGPAVPAGLTRYASRVFGADYRHSFFAAMFNLRKVTRHVLVPHGATFRTRDTDFLVSDDRDFHPTDVVEDADGSLLVIDTGPWYKLCCPTSQLAKPEVFGAIYRVRRTGAPRVNDPRGRRIAWDRIPPSEMTTLLADPRPAVVTRVLQAFAKAGGDAVPALAGALRSRSADSRLNAVWALTRIEGPGARAAVRTRLDDRDEGVRRAAAYSAGLWRDSQALTALQDALTTGRPAVQRTAAEALGRIGDARSVAHLIAAAAAPIDRVLEHSLTYAVIEIGDPRATTAAALVTRASRSKRTALIALDQMRGGRLAPEQVIPLLDSADSLLRTTAWWIARGHPEWGGVLEAFFRARITSRTLSAAERAELAEQLAAFTSQMAIQRLIAGMLVDGAQEARLVALGAMSAAASPALPAAARMKELPAPWASALARALSGTDAVVRQALDVLRAIPAGGAATAGLDAALLGVARDANRPLEIRLDALSARPAAATLERDLFELVRTSLGPAVPAPGRARAAAVMERARLDRGQLLALAEVLGEASPLELPRLLQPFDRSADEEAGLAMLAALQRSKARSTLRAEMLRPRLAKYPPSVQRAGETLLAAIHAGEARQVDRLNEILAAAQGGDVARGQAVFNSSRAACSSCHAIGYLGGRIGPDLTRIGQVRSDRDLVEAIVFPNASFARGYEPVVVRTRTGLEHRGALRSDAPDEIVLTSATGRETQIPRWEIVAIDSDTTSLMPPGYAELLTREELADLVAFLKAAR
jgi:putative membrane-bound dehydrogenase-like protein